MKKIIFLLVLIPVLCWSQGMQVLENGTEVYVDSTGWGVHLIFPEATWWIDYEGDSLDISYLIQLGLDSLGATVSLIGTAGYIEHPAPEFRGWAAAYWTPVLQWAAAGDSLNIDLYDAGGQVARQWRKRPDRGSLTDLNDYGRIMFRHLQENPLGKIYVNGMKIYPKGG